ncbi:hypothetical protein P3X46_006809 [Hevea brasiliensis]|uniref:Epidermal patterning factor-like protein n=1 Tax=Hevea brasiliensis TaxID=3981 RepID=A0ABQ9MTW7_HEVBR|nr:hypothetical protein P3X46_006809 [Hevea brasiliensis]
MKNISFLAAALLLIPLAAFARDPQWLHSRNDNGDQEQHPAWPRTGESRGTMGTPTSNAEEEVEEKKIKKQGREVPLQIAGSRLPDCLHACGSCTLCGLVIVSSVCASLAQAAKTYPISYRCMCNHKLFHKHSHYTTLSYLEMKQLINYVNVKCSLMSIV